MKDALVALVLKTDISIGGADPAQCGPARAVHGHYTPEQALREMVGHGHCTIQRFNASTYRLVLRPATVAAAPRPVTHATAQDSDDVTVLVVRRPQRVGDTPSALSVVPASILSGNDRDLSNVAVRVAGMAVTNLGPGRDKILLRGISDSVLTGRTQSTVGLYLDDTPITYNAPSPDLLLADMARVEVLKGPQGALYGQGSLSGVVRLVTNKPMLDAYEGSLDVGVGVTQDGEPSSRVVGVLNLPVWRDHLALRGVLYDDRSGGFIKNTDAADKATNTTRRYGGRLEMGWKISDSTQVTGSFVSQRLNSENSQYITGQMGPFQRSVPLAEPHDNYIQDGSLGLESETELGTVKIALNQLSHHVFSGYDAQPLTQIVTIPNSGVLFYDEDQDMTLGTREISLVSKSDQPLRWLAGVFSADSEEHFNPHLIDAFTQKTVYNEARIDRIHDLAAFAQLVYDLGPHWTLSAGLRQAYTNHVTESQINHVRLTNYARDGDVTGLIKAERLTHTFALQYRPNQQLMVYFQSGDGYRTGGFNTTTLAVTAIPSAYAGDELDSYELGMRYRTADHRLRMNLTGFHVLWRDIQSDQLRSIGLPITVNLGDGVNNGVEFETDWQALQNLSLHAAAQINDPRLTKPGPLYPNDKNSGMPYIAKSSFSVSADWDQSLWHKVLENSAIVSFRGASPINYGPLRTVRMGAYANLDLSSAMTVGHIRYGVRVDNATGVDANSFAYGNPFSINASNQITPLRPRTLWLSLGYHY